MDTIGTRIKKIRKERNVTQKEFSERICVGQSYVSRLESDKEVPTDMLVKLISLEFRTNYDWLRSGKGEPFIENSDDYDYWERKDAEGMREGARNALDSLCQKLESLKDPTIDHLLSSAIYNLTWLLNLYDDDSSFGITILEQITHIILAFYDHVKRINKLDKTNDGQYMTSLHREIWLAEDDIKNSLRAVSIAYSDRTK